MEYLGLYSPSKLQNRQPLTERNNLHAKLQCQVNTVAACEIGDLVPITLDHSLVDCLI